MNYLITQNQKTTYAGLAAAGVGLLVALGKITPAVGTALVCFIVAVLGAVSQDAKNPSPEVASVPQGVPEMVAQTEVKP